MTATNDYRSLHEITSAQLAAVTALARGATHEAAANEAGVHRVTVSRWAAHHPAFIAELNARKVEAATEAAAQVSRTTRKALDVIAEVIDGGDADAAFRWLRLVPLITVTEPLIGSTESTGVVESIRRAMPSEILEVLTRADQRSTAEVEEIMRSSLRREEPKVTN